MKPRKPLKRSQKPLKRTPLKRSTKPIAKGKPPRKKRPGTRRGQPTKAEKTALRDQVYEESGGRCELNLSPQCIRGVIPKDGDTPWNHWHLVHLKSKRVHGWARENLCGGCHFCHLIELHRGGKVVPKKEREDPLQEGEETV